MSHRLDISALIALVGPDRLRAELAKTSYRYQVVSSYTSRRGRIPEINHTYDFSVPKGVNVVEWLIFNHRQFFFDLYRIYENKLTELNEMVVHDLPKDQQTQSTTWANAYWSPLKDNEIPTPWAEALWLFVRQLDVEDLQYEMVSDDPSYQLFDGYGDFLLEGWDGRVDEN